MLQTKEEQGLDSLFYLAPFIVRDGDNDLHIKLAKQFNETYFRFMKKLARLMYEPVISKAEKEELTILFNKVLYLKNLVEEAEKTKD